MSQLTTYSMRPLSAEDQPFLWEMLYQAIFIPEGEASLPREIIHSPELARYVENWGQPDDLGFLAIDAAGAEPMGAAWLRRFTADGKGYAYLDEETPELSIALLPGHRGKGIGTTLISALQEAAQARYKSICLSVSADNPAVRLYQRLGFEVVKEDDTSLIMRKTW